MKNNTKKKFKKLFTQNLGPEEIESFFEKDLIEFEAKPIKVAWKRIFIFSWILLTTSLMGISEFAPSYYANPHAWSTRLMFFSTLLSIMALSTFARYIFEYLLCFIVTFVIVYIRIDILNSYGLESMIFIIVSFAAIYVMVNTIDSSYQVRIKKIKKENKESLNEMKARYIKGYENTQAELEYAATLFGFLVAAAVVVKNVYLKEYPLLIESLILAAAYAAFVRFCVSAVMKRKLNKFKSSD